MRVARVARPEGTATALGDVGFDMDDLMVSVARWSGGAVRQCMWGSWARDTFGGS